MFGYDAITGVMRALVPAAVAWGAGAGYIPSESAGDVIAALTAVGAAGWSIFNNRPGKTVE
jgi:hypothetical protein